MPIEYSREFIKQFKKAPRNIQRAFRKKLLIFIKDKFDPRLNNHPFKGKLKGYHSINVTGDWRAIFREFNSETTFFVVIGSHSQLYK